MDCRIQPHLGIKTVDCLPVYRLSLAAMALVELSHHHTAGTATGGESMPKAPQPPPTTTGCTTSSKGRG